jgi:uncharacterized protein YprB with RNaseH-like and TPR domain
MNYNLKIGTKEVIDEKMMELKQCAIPINKEEINLWSHYYFKVVMDYFNGKAYDQDYVKRFKEVLDPAVVPF